MKHPLKLNADEDTIHPLCDDVTPGDFIHPTVEFPIIAENHLSQPSDQRLTPFPPTRAVPRTPLIT